MAYNVSSAFREQCYSGSSLYKCRLIIGEETIPTSQIASITISSPIVDSENEIFYIGTFISQKLTIQFKNLDGINTKSGTGVELYISQYVNNNWEEVPIGKYIIDESPEDYYKSSKIECLDYAIKFATNLDYSPAFVDNKITIDNLLQWICDYYGVTLGSYPSTNGDIEIGTYDSTISGKRWISYIAELKGCNAKMDRLGQLTLVPLKSSPVATIDAKKSKSWELGEKFEVSKVTYFDATRNYTFGDDTENTLILRQDNPFVVNEQVVRNIYENLRLASSMVEENTNFTLENTVEGEPIGSLSLKGDTQQDTTTGKNLLHTTLTSQTKNNVNVVVNDDGTIILNGTSNAVTWLTLGSVTLQAGTYIMSQGNTDGTTRMYSDMSSYTSNGTKTFTIEETTTQNVYINIPANTTLNNLVFNPMIRLASITDATYEPYTNGASPNPDYPQEIKVVTGDNELKVVGKNLFDKSSTPIYFDSSMQYTETDTGCKLRTSSSGNGFVLVDLGDIKQYENKSLTFSMSNTPSSLYQYIAFIACNNDGSNRLTIGSALGYSSNTLTTTIGSNYTQTRLTIRLYIDGGTENTDYELNNIMVEKGSSATDFEPYKSFTQEIDLPVENLIGLDTSQYQVNLKAGDKITAKNTTSSILTLNLYTNYGDTTRNDYWTIGSNATRTITIAYNTKAIAWSSNVASGGYAWINYGDNINAYYPYGTTPIELCKIGDYKDYIRKSTGINLIDFSDKSGSINNFYYKDYSTNYVLEEGVTYTLSLDAQASITPFQLSVGCGTNGYQKDILTKSNLNNGRVYITFTPTSTLLSYGTKLFFRCPRYGSKQTVSFTLKNIMLEKSSTPNEYEPYGTVWYIHKEIGKVVLDGTQDISVSNWRASETSVGWLYPHSIVNSIVPTSNLQTGLVIADKLREGTYKELYEKSVDNGIGLVNSDTYSFAIRTNNTTLTTNSAINTYLSSNPIEVYYVLATPTNTEITDTELIEQLEHFEHNAKFYGGVTNITSTCPITFKLFTSDPFICYSLKTENYGDISLDSWDNITYTLGEETYNTLNNNTVTYEMTIMSKAETKIPTKQQEVTTNVVGGNVEQRVRRIGSEVNNLSGQVTILGEEVDETSESLAEFTLTTDASIQSLTQTTSNIASEEQTHYQEMLSKMDDKASISDIETITNQVNVLQTDTYTKTEIQKIIDGTDENGLRVQVVQTTTGTFNEDGMTYRKTNAKTSSTINETGLKVYEGSDMTKELMFAGYDTQKLEALVRVANLYLTQFLGVDVWRIEIINDPTNGKGLGFFYIG